MAAGISSALLDMPLADGLKLPKLLAAAKKLRGEA
jgi:hypothetical protein